MKNFLLKISIAFICLYFSRPVNQDIPPIDIQEVIKDFTNAELDVPKKYVNEFRIELFHLDGYVVAHLKFKKYEEAFMPCSFIGIYKLNSGKWQFIKIDPFNYDLQLIDKKLGLFLSNNEFCNMTGRCSYFSLLSKFEKTEMNELVSYSGFDYHVNYSFRITQENENPKSLIGDTITHTVLIRNPKINKKDEVIYNLEKKVSILREVQEDSLIVETKTDLIVDLKIKQ